MVVVVVVVVGGKGRRGRVRCRGVRHGGVTDGRGI